MKMHPPKKAYSLVELLVVITIIGLMATISLPAFARISQANALTTGSALLVDQLKLAKQIAITRNHPIEVRFYELPDTSQSNKKMYRALQFFTVEDTTYLPLGRIIFLPHGICISDSMALSTLFETGRTDITFATGASTGVSIPGVGTAYNYAAFRFTPDGSTTLTNPACITLLSANDATVGGSLPKNWFSAQINPVTGAVQIYRP